MQHSHALSGALVTLWLVGIPAAVLGPVLPAPASAETVLPFAPFKSVTLRNGGQVILRHAPTQRVTLVKGSTSCTQMTIVDGDRLVIDKRRHDCPKGYELLVEILAPEITEIGVMDGGSIQTRGSFPRQPELGAAVGQGGTIDLRSMTVDFVAAAVNQGGRIFTKPRKALAASITHGGGVTYWGNPEVTSSIEKGGVVARGSAADADKPLMDLEPRLPVIPPVPPTPVRGSI